MDDRGAKLRWQLEGRLAGIWVSELQECWRAYTAHTPHKGLVVDLTHTEFVDLAGEYLLTLMHRSGVKLTTRTPYMMALLANITGTAPAVARRATDDRSEGDR